MKNNLKAARLNKGIKATDLAKALHVSKQTVSSWENNRRNPDIETYVKLADLYDVSLDFLVGREFKSDKQDFDLIEIFSKIKFIFGRGQAVSECLFAMDKNNYV